VVLGLIERRNLQRAAALHFTSEAAAQAFSTPSFLLPLGVELPQVIGQLVILRLGAPVRFLFLSRLHPKKQLPLLLQALALICRRHGAELRRQADQLGLTEHLQWHGFVTGQAKAELLQRADWFVLPSAAENFWIAAIEALTEGLMKPLMGPSVTIRQAVRRLAETSFCSDAIASALKAGYADNLNSVVEESSACRLF